MFEKYEISLVAIVVDKQSEICNNDVLQVRHEVAKLNKSIDVNLSINVKTINIILNINLNYNDINSAKLLHKKRSRKFECRYRRSRLVVENDNINIKRTNVDNSFYFASLF